VELALACAIYSARTNLPLPAKTAIAGELSLAGEVRPLRRQGGRVKAAKNLGFNSFLGPVSDEADIPAGAGYAGVRDIKAAIKSVFS
jgi:DNA repair protein RadA/Sms